MQYTPIKRKIPAASISPGVYADRDELMRLRFKASGFSFLPRQPIHSVLSGRHASRLRGRGLNFEELRSYLRGWMGYKVFYDWTMHWLLAAGTLAVASLGVHFWRKYAARPWDA